MPTPTNRTDEVSMTPRKHIVGDGCKCGAYGAYECGCQGVDWRSSREVELESELTQFRQSNDRLHTHNADLEVEIGKWVNLIKQIGFKVKCLYSNFPDDNGHILSKIDEQIAIASAITSAVEAERERCAKVAEDLKKMSDAWDSLIGIVVKTHHHDSVFDASCSICNDINTACRNVEICRQTIRQTPTKEGV